MRKKAQAKVRFKAGQIVDSIVEYLVISDKNRKIQVGQVHSAGTNLIGSSYHL
jgi:hypothetical protein